MVRESHRKIKSLEDLAVVAAQAREEGKSVILCHGVFDLVHMGHVRHFQKAREEGDILIATLTTEKHVNKGPGRPVFNDAMRSEMLAALEHVDWVAVSPYPSAENVIEALTNVRWSRSMADGSYSQRTSRLVLRR